MTTETTATNNENLGYTAEELQTYLDMVNEGKQEEAVDWLIKKFPTMETQGYDQFITAARAELEKAEDNDEAETAEVATAE